jgi:PAS domain S-box-containing protein
MSDQAIPLVTEPLSVQQIVARSASAVAAMLGTAALIGWASGDVVLTRLLSGLPAMQPLTAVSLILLGVAVAGSTAARPWPHALGHLATALAVAIAITALVEAVSGTSGFVERVLFGHAVATDPHRGRIPPSSAVGILLVAGAVSAVAWKRRVLAQIFGVLAFGGSLLGVLLYVYGDRSAYAIDEHSAMALLTALGLTAASIGVLAAVPGGFLPGLILRAEPSTVLLRQVLPVILIGLPLIGLLRLEGEQRGLYGAPAGVAIMTLVAGGLLLVTAWRVTAVTDWSGYLVSQPSQSLRLRLASIVEESEDAIISEALDSTVTSWNHGAELLLGYTREEMVGRSLAVILPEGMTGVEADLLQEVRQGQRIKSMDSIRRHRDGSFIPVSLTMTPIRDPSGTVVGTVKTLRDITDRKQAEATIARALGAAEAASREYAAFSYSVAHDLRAPLRAMNGFSQALLEEYGDLLDDAGRGYAERIQAAARTMDQLIAGLLTLARATQRELASHQVDLSGMAGRIIAGLRAASPERDVQVSIQSGMIDRGDPALLAVVLDNLLGNAWKFTCGTPGAIIEFSYRQDDEGRTYIVRDTGAGFDMAYSAKLFQPFQRLHSSWEFEGAGIGLATAERIIKRHGGRIWAHGEVGAGAVFSFTLEGADDAQRRPMN